MKGWVNCDLRPNSEKVLRIDLLREFPFLDGSVKFCYAEHVLEHFSIDELRIMLKHIFRVMQEGGIFRIAQPDLQKMIQDTLLSNNYAKQKNLYSATKERDLPTGIHYLNFIWNAWGHKFNHSYESLKYELERAGFRKVAKCLYHQSEYPELCSVENRSRKDDSLILEAVK
jgi:predicted SAM-dependent methyltransferase